MFEGARDLICFKSFDLRSFSFSQSGSSFGFGALQVQRGSMLSLVGEVCGFYIFGDKIESVLFIS